MGDEWCNIRDAREYVQIERGQADHRFIDSSIFKTKSDGGVRTADAYEISVQADLQAIYESIERNHKYPPVEPEYRKQFGNQPKRDRKLSDTIDARQSQHEVSYKEIMLESPKMSRLSQKDVGSGKSSQLGINEPNVSKATPKEIGSQSNQGKPEPAVKFAVDEAVAGDQNLPMREKPSSGADSHSSLPKQTKPLVDLSKVCLPLQNDSNCGLTQ